MANPPPGTGAPIPPPPTGLVSPTGDPLRSAEGAQQQRDLEVRAKLLRAEQDHDKQVQRSIETLRRSGMAYEDIARSIGASGKEVAQLATTLRQWNTVTLKSVQDLKELVNMPIGEIFGRLKEGTLKFAYSTQVSIGMIAVAGKKLFEIAEQGALTVNRSGVALAGQTGARMSGNIFGATGSGLVDKALQDQILRTTNLLQMAFHIAPESFTQSLSQVAAVGGRAFGGAQTVEVAGRASIAAAPLGIDPAQAARLFSTIMLRTGEDVNVVAKRFAGFGEEARHASMSNSQYVDSLEKLIDQTYKQGVSVDTATRLTTLFGKDVNQMRVSIQDVGTFATGIEGQSPQHRVGLALLAKQMGVGGLESLSTNPLEAMRQMREASAKGKPLMGVTQASQLALKMAGSMGTSFENAAELVLPQIFGGLPTEATARQSVIEKIKGLGLGTASITEGLGASESSSGRASLEAQSQALAEAGTGLGRVLKDAFDTGARTLTESIRGGDWRAAGHQLREGFDATGAAGGVQGMLATLLTEILNSKRADAKNTPD